MKLRYLSVFFFVFMFAWEGSAANPELNVNYKPVLPMTLAGAFYTDANAKPSSIEDIISWGNFLYLTTQYVNGDQKLEVWDISNPAEPYLKQALDYGNLKTTPTDHWKFPYVNVFDNTILIRSNFSEIAYHHNELGELVEDGWYDFAQTAAEMKNNEESLFMSAAGSFGTFFGRLFDPYDVLPEQEYGYAVLNFANPRRPFAANLVLSSTDVWFSESFPGHLNAALGNIPGNIRIDGNRIVFSGRKAMARGQFDVFWGPRLSQIFNADALNRTVRDQIETIVKAQPYTERFAAAVENFFQDLGIEADRTVEEAVQKGYEGAQKFQQILDDYEINRDESVRVAIRKIVAKELTVDLQKELAVSLFSPLLQDWTARLFAIPSLASKEDILQFVTNILNKNLDPSTVARYILDNYIAPYVDTPDWMHWTMEEFVDKVVNTPAGEAISAAIGAAHTVATADGFLETALAFVPEAQEFYLPAGFPENARDVLEYAFFENGAKLNRQSLAFMEMLKFYQYYNGDSDYLNYENQLAEAVKEAQEQLAGTAVDAIEPFLDAVSFAGDVASRIREFSKTLSIREPITLAISDAIAARLQASGLDVSLSVHEACLKYKLYLSLEDAVGLTDNDLAKVQDFIQILKEQIHQAEIPIKTLWDEGKAYAAYIEKAMREALASVLQEAWGEIELDEPMANALFEFIGHHIDYRWTFGQTMDDLLKDYIYSALTVYPGYLDFISVWDRAVKGDVIARWQATFQAAKIASAALDWTGSLPATYEMLELTLQESYQQAMAAASKSLLMEFAQILMKDMYGSFAKWGTATEELTYSFDASQFSALKPVRTAAFAWENRIGLLPREEWDYIHPRRVSLMLFDPADPTGVKYESILQGSWGDVDYVHANQGIVMIGGTLYDGIWPKPSAMILALEGNQVDAHILNDYRLASSEGMLTANHGSILVLYGPGGVFLFPNPRTLKAGNPQPGTAVKSWDKY